MNNLIKGKLFNIGFSFGIILIILGNFYTLLTDNSRAICFDCYKTWGFPFVMHESGTMLHLSNFIWSGVVANVFIAIFFSFIVGLIFKFIWSKLPEKQLK